MMKKIYIDNEKELFHIFSSAYSLNKDELYEIVIKKKIALHSDLVINIPVTFSFDGGFLDTQDYSITLKQNP